MACALFRPILCTMRYCPLCVVVPGIMRLVFVHYFVISCVECEGYYTGTRHAAYKPGMDCCCTCMYDFNFFKAKKNPGGYCKSWWVLYVHEVLWGPLDHTHSLQIRVSKTKLKRIYLWQIRQ